MSFDIYASGTGRWNRSWTGVTVGEVLDAATYMGYAAALNPSGAVTAVQAAGNFVNDQLSMQDGLTGNLTTLGAVKLSQVITSLMSSNPNRFHVAVSARESSTVLMDSAGYWEDELKSYEDPYYTLMTGIQPILEETNLLCMGVLSGIADALEAWDKRAPRGGGRPRILIQINSDVFWGDFGPSREEMRH